MENMIVVCGEWKFDRKRWVFVVDAQRGSRVVVAASCMRYATLIGMVFDDFGLDKREYDVKLSYMLPKEMVKKLPEDTPPVYISNCRQFQVFLGQFKGHCRRICVELKQKIDVKTLTDENQFGKIDVKQEDGFGKAEHNQKEDCDADDESRFDCCDDSDGTDSGDEKFEAFGMKEEDDDQRVKAFGMVDEDDPENLKLPPKKRSASVFVSEGNANVANLLKCELNDLDLAVGQWYDTKEQLVIRMKVLTVLQKFDFNIHKSTPFLLTAKCWVKGCSWKVRATPIGDYPRFHVRKHVSEHTCSVTERAGRCRQATHDILGIIYTYFVGGIGRSVLPIHVAEALNKRFQINISYWKAYRTLRHARELVKGTQESGYELLPTYLYMIKRENPGSHTRLVVDEQHRFKYLFIAFGASINGFPFLRKVVVVDGTFLQGKYKGTLLTATGQDGNFNLFPIAFAVVDTENDESWRWFFEQLNKVIPDDEGIAIISDRHKSIGKAIATVYPKCSRGICTYHLYKNILVRFKGREAFSLVKKAAYAFRVVDFERAFNDLKAVNPALHAYLERADVRLWTRVHFPGDRYNILTTNIAESMNHVLSKSRKLPIVQLLEAIRTMMTRWFDSRRNSAMVLQTTLTGGVEKLLQVTLTLFHNLPCNMPVFGSNVIFLLFQNRVVKSKLLTVQNIDVIRVQVNDGSGSVNVVNLRDRKCTCRRFDLEKMPCEHAIAAAEKMNISRISLCHLYYHRSYLYNAYATAIMPRDFSVPVPEHVAIKVCSPPLCKQQPGRPKKSRIKPCLEIALEKKRTRKQNACGNCNEVGHNRQTCKLP